MRNRICIACGEKLPDDPLLELSGCPASAQDIPGKDEVDADHGISLSLYQCPNCGLVQFDCEPVGYYRDVIRSGGFSTTMMELRRRQYDHLITACHLEGKTFLEVGCGQGEFLTAFEGFPVRAYGIEHKKELVDLAQGRGLSVWQQFADGPDTVLEAPDGDGKPPYDVFLSFNFLEHQPDPVGMLRCIHNNLAEDGYGLVTVPSLEYILQYNGYYELIRDHLAYYTFDTLQYVLERAGFEILEKEMVNRDTLSVIVKKTARTDECSGENEKKRSGEADLTGLKHSMCSIREEADRLLADIHSRKETLAIWGASHQGFTLAATLGLSGKVEYIIDSAPFKQGRFAPASHIPIVSPDEWRKSPADHILIVAPGYTEEIASIIRKQRKTTGVYTLRSSRIEKL